MNYALFLGCTIPARARNYEMSALQVSKALNLELKYLDAFSCCGFPLKSYDMVLSGVVAARNLTIAAENELDIVTLCSACTAMLKEETHHLSMDSDYSSQVKEKLRKIGMEYKTGTNVIHFGKLISKPEYLEKLKSLVKVDLKNIPIAIHYGCHYLKPSHVFDDKEDPENPKSLHEIVNAIGAMPIEYKGQRDCCGGAVLAFDESTATNISKNKLLNIKKAGAKVIMVVCPFCNVMYDDGQKAIEKRYEVEIGIPVLFLPQLVGLAMGIEPKALGLNLNTVKTKTLLEEILGS